MTAGMRPERVPEYAALGGSGGNRLMGGSSSPSIGEVSGEGDSNGVAVAGNHHGHHGARVSKGCSSPVDGRFGGPGQSRPMIARTSGSGTWLRAVRCSASTALQCLRSPAHMSVQTVLSCLNNGMCVRIKCRCCMLLFR